METEKDVKNIYYKVPKQRDLISRITLEILAVGGISIFLLARYVWDKSKLPYDRGFYCNDGNLKHPYLKETISEKACLGIWVVIGLIVIPVMEFVHFRVFKYENWKNAVKQRGGCVSKLGGMPSFVLEFYRICGYFLVGLLVCLVTTQVAKYQIGRLRPYFLFVCNTNLTSDMCKDKFEYEKFVSIPQETQQTICKGPWDDWSKLKNQENEYHWIYEECKGQSDVECLNDILNEARKSFMSGHASFSFYCATFLIIYLHSRLSYNQPPGSIKQIDGTKVYRIFLRGMKVLRPFIQFLLFIVAFWVALTRIKDYRHHPMDVVTGALVGMAFSMLILFGLVDIFNRPRSFTSTDTNYHDGYKTHENLKRSISQDTNMTEVDGKKKANVVSDIP